MTRQAVCSTGTTPNRFRDGSELVPRWLRVGSEPWRSRQKAQAGLLLRISRANAAAIQSAEPDVATGSVLHRNDSELAPKPVCSRQKAQAGLLLRISRANAAAIQSAEPDVATGSALHRNDSELVPSWLRAGMQQAKSSNRVASED